MNKSGRVPESLRKLAAERAANCCEYCLSQQRFAPDPFCAEHIVPRALSGPTNSENLAWSCLGCNSLKHTHISGVDPGTGHEVALFHPRQDQWTSHFVWDAEYVRVIGVTPKGRATVHALQLNREPLLNLRRILRAADLHPPSHVR